MIEWRILLFDVAKWAVGVVLLYIGTFVLLGIDMEIGLPGSWLD